MPHAFLISGATGSGKRTLALEIAKALNCENREKSDLLPCGRCNACRRITEGNYTDVKILEKPKDRATLGVDPIKLMREDSFLSATESDYKIYIIDDAETMTPEAQNALLKVLEEPPPSVVIMLLATEADKMLTTVRSRVQYIAMEKFPPEKLRSFILQKSADAKETERSDPERFNAVIMGADGRIGMALTLLNKKQCDALEEEREDVLRLIRAAKSGVGYLAAYTAVAALPQKRNELSEILELATTAIRDLIAIHGAKNAPLTFFVSREECAALSGSIGQKRLFEVYDAITEAIGYCHRNGGVSNITANLATKICSR
jgi:DNA polymerase-3 subunit delta'